MILDLTDDTIDSSIQDNDNIMISFSAPWCSSCKMMVPMWDTLLASNAGLKMGKLDVDKNEVAMEKYGISGLPTILFFKKGELITKQSGPAPKSVIQTKINSILN